MITFAFCRYLLGITTFALLLSGCETVELASAPPIGQPARTVAKSANRVGSWTLHEAGNKKLLYATSGRHNEVAFLSYPQGKLVGKIRNIEEASGVCSDSRGDVWIGSGSDSGGVITEFPQGGVNPIATLKVPGDFPICCAVDPAGGNLAVAHDSQFVSIFTGAQGSPQTYKDEQIGIINSITYDQSGDLFAYGCASQYGSVLGELSAGASAFASFTLKKKMTRCTFGQWGGSHMLLAGITGKGGEAPETVWKVAIAGSQLKVLSEKTFSPLNKLIGFGPEATVEKTTLIQPDLSGKVVNYYSLLTGGNPIQTIRRLQGGMATSVAVSADDGIPVRR